MAFIYEVNGQRVEFDREPTEADIDEAARSLGAPPPAADSSGLQMTAEPSAGEAVAAVAAPAVTGAAFAKPMGVTAEQIGRVAGPVMETVKQTYRGPMGVVRGVADATMMAHGVPPLAGAYGAAEATMARRAQAVGTAAGEISKGLSQTPMMTSPVTGSQYPSGVPDYRAMQKAVPDAAGRLTEIYSKGGPNAVRAFLQTPEAAPYLNNPAFKQAAESYIGKVPGAMAQAGKVASTVARGAGRVLGPAGMAMSLYDAGQMARETQLGERLAAGQGQRAEQAFRGGMGMTYQGPQLDSQQAQNVLQSGSQRDIQYFGGKDRLTEMVRRKAAEKVFGPVAPGSF
jgi:hypothetical protein